jgi:MATE family multidrug resistance protein
VLRGVGEQKMGLIGSFIGYYVVGLPLGWYLARFSGLLGLWHGMTAGCAVALGVNSAVYSLIDWRKIKAPEEDE